jgi:hypothetical protein
MAEMTEPVDLVAAFERQIAGKLGTFRLSYGGSSIPQPDRVGMKI